MNDKIKINLQIADSNYPLTINREEEEMVREAAKQVNIRLNAYREYYKNLEPEKIIAMVAYQFSLEKLQLMQRNDTTPYTEKVKELTELLEDYFKKEECHLAIHLERKHHALHNIRANVCSDIWRCVFIYITKLM